ncbi:MAG: hypothetical protein LBU73_07160 [Helicobacteraceae bacterium]|nr:hypothetical protein [Helicobacteraceae bacterium]
MGCAPAKPVTTAAAASAKVECPNGQFAFKDYAWQKTAACKPVAEYSRFYDGRSVGDEITSAVAQYREGLPTLFDDLKYDAYVGGSATRTEARVYRDGKKVGIIFIDGGFEKLKELILSKSAKGREAILNAAFVYEVEYDKVEKKFIFRADKRYNNPDRYKYVIPFSVVKDGKGYFYIKLVYQDSDWIFF